MGDIPMPGGWTMSMMWMRMPEATWLGTAASFLGMWVSMTAAMMLPSLIPTLWHFVESVRSTGRPRVGQLTALVAAAYFFVWSLIGIAVFSLGAAVAAIAMEQPALARTVPAAAGIVIVLAGALQLTRWKARHLGYCRQAPDQTRDEGRGRRGEGRGTRDAGTAWRYGLCLGLHCAQSCAALMMIVLVVGIMDLRAMAVVTAAISVERLAPFGVRVARAIGGVAVAAGFVLIVRAGLG